MPLAIGSSAENAVAAVIYQDRRSAFAPLRGIIGTSRIKRRFARVAAVVAIAFWPVIAFIIVRLVSLLWNS